MRASDTAFLDGWDYETVQAQIYRWAYRFMRNHHDTLDAVQIVLMKLLETKTAVPVEHKSAWLRRVTINHCLDQLRKIRPMIDHATITKSPEQVQSMQLCADYHEQLTGALGELTDMQRLVLLAKECEGETFEQIAAMLGVSGSTVKTHYLRALRKVRDMFLKNGETKT